MRNQFSAECIFKEEMLENLFNLYSSCSYGSKHKPWYVALKQNGRPKRGNRARKKKKSTHFMFVKYDGDKPNEVFENIAKLRRQSGGHSRPIRYVEDHGDGKSVSELQPLNASLQAMLRALNATKSGGNLVVKQLESRNIVRNSFKKRVRSRLEREELKRTRRREQLKLLRLRAKLEEAERKKRRKELDNISLTEKLQQAAAVTSDSAERIKLEINENSAWISDYKRSIESLKQQINEIEGILQLPTRLGVS
ncbi:unnamed protein product [Enterobius vermicularis]|uniref:BZIP domain-containing protein n=1 Tax=Enterobius vermicularis TaxID=51028 RepID=A0A0N4VD68_ENTVE|nr:unnamed protein product [Enterobius vermicularis]